VRWLLCVVLLVSCRPAAPAAPAVGALSLRVRSDETGALRIEDLPHGRYRIYSDALRTGSEDAPEFAVAGRETIADVTVPACQKRRVFLKIYDAAGHLIEAAECRRGGCHVWNRPEARYPPWRVERKSKRPRFRTPVGGVPGCGPGEKTYHPVQAGRDGFDLGLHRDNARATGSFAWWEFRTPGPNYLSIGLKCEVTRDRTFVGIALSREIVGRSVFLPDGGLAADHLGVSLLCEPVLENTGPVPLRIRVSGYEDIRLRLHVGEVFPICRLKAKAP